MPDFSMCIRMDCDVRDQCKRHRESGTKADDRQVYNDFRHEIPGKSCSGFWQVNPVEKVSEE